MLWIRSGIEILRSQRSLAVVAVIKKTNDHAEPTKVERLQKHKKYQLGYYLLWFGVLVHYNQ